MKNVPSPDQALDPELARGLVYIHEKLGTRVLADQQLSRHVYALTELLVGSGLVSLAELEERKKSLETRPMSKKGRTAWKGAEVLEDARDKYAVAPAIIDCDARIMVCKAACCRLSFFLTRQDLEENRIRWDVGRPFHIARRDDGYCTHCDAETGGCAVHEHRPIVCRGYDCRDDERIWKDFASMTPSDEVAALPRLAGVAPPSGPPATETSSGNGARSRSTKRRERKR